MIQKRFVNLFFLSICLIGIVGTGTHALLIAHLACCEESASCDEHTHHDEPDQPIHDHANCSFCQWFSEASGKYLVAADSDCPLTDAVGVCPVRFTSQHFIQHTLNCVDPRGPPAV